MIKKILLSVAVIAIFAAYALFLRGTKNNTRVADTAVPTADDITTTATPTATARVAPTSTPVATATPTSASTSAYQTGTYTSPVEDAFYGNLQFKLVVSGGKITDVQFTQYPNDRHDSVEVSNFSLPILKSETIKAQSANVDIVSGATQTSLAFQEGLKVVLAQAKN
jgi:uncharacterized protein with FMN-binding domain